MTRRIGAKALGDQLYSYIGATPDRLGHDAKRARADLAGLLSGITGRSGHD
ncbi:TPA: hypothetical protein N0H91_005905 [Pseudomonas aeruginosa]|uniref:hypothetical protein n=1 Tax=Pseudomonas aeruginosa TaxID=287 RepID=UPI0013BEA95A|nr:hypothetical protein [Pseudomonas aeruginosa]MBH4267654.1 hypothetical protein [Pseudomonas aeruginosa]HCK5061512.1 hypothetical protein [Pseudomonas aeruginosa]